MRLLVCVSVAVCVSLLGRSGAGAKECEVGKVRCGDSDQCVNYFFLCAGNAWCSNSWDALNCTSCKPNSFLCDGSRCVKNEHKCDGVSWCRDGADEANCTSIKGEPYCEPSSRCNGVWGDCVTGDDELLCTPDMCQAPATKEAYSGGRCRDPNARCNGVVNFRDEDDEDNCTECIGGAVFCDGRCLAPGDVCDGWAQCANGADELNCTSCQEGSFMCDGSRCVKNDQKCDGVTWCRDGTDEADCTSIKSVPLCPASSRCNGELDCWTLDDELLCTPDMCQAPATKGAYSGGRCRDPNARCNGVVNFRDEVDEDNCTECNSDVIFSDGRCLDPEVVCDGKVDCLNGADELNCTSCNKNSFLCDESRCVNNKHKCDGVVWCSDGTDEAHCTKIRRSPECSASSRCNGKLECWTRDDELLCTPDMCQAPATKEAYSGGRCRDPNARCNGVVNFPDEKDEDNCTECNGGAFFCNGSCLAPKNVCDGWAQCSNGADELNCTSCQAGSFMCDGYHCVDTLHKCDGVTWCRDGTDEANCTSLEIDPACRASSRCNGLTSDCWTRDDELHCTPDMCQAPATSSSYCDGRCLKASSWCDGIADCADGQDEAKCPRT